MTSFFQSLGMSYEGAWFTATIAGILLIAFPLMLAVALIIYSERKLWAAFALRRGPNVVGPFGILQSFADGLKVFLQETIIPSASNRGLFLIAPIITFTVALMAWAVIPFADGVVLSDINVGLLYILAISSLGVYGVIISGWASNSKYPFYSSMRAAAQMISYEVSIGFILICVVLWAGSFNMGEIIAGQKGHIFGFINAYALNPLLFPIAVMFLISAMAETARAPFDLTEAESEIVAGYQTEYSSMAFALFWLGEYANVLLMCALNAILFWGGHLPPVDWAPLYMVPGIIWFFAKILVMFFIFAWVKATVPRYRYDQLMRLGWKVFLPISLFWVFLVSGYLMLTRDWGSETTSAVVEKHYICTNHDGLKIEVVSLATKTDWRWLINEGKGWVESNPALIPAANKTPAHGTELAWKTSNGATQYANIDFSDFVQSQLGANGWITFKPSGNQNSIGADCNPTGRKPFRREGAELI